MAPDQPQDLTPAQADERACAERVDYWLKKFGCALKGVCIIEDGSARIQVGIVKIPPEVLKAMKEAQKNGQQPPAAAAA